LIRRIEQQEVVLHSYVRLGSPDLLSKLLPSS
jgi:hypothetical protein